MEVWQSVKVKNTDHPRAGEAGTVHAVDKTKPEQVAVKFDTDQQIQLVDVADLQQLG
jgi:aspartyl/asparaginyl beta-hydroxylase (cupin superfamily)